MDEDLEEINERLKRQQSEVVEGFNKALAKLLARMTNEQREKAIVNKSTSLLNNIFASAYNSEYYEVCQSIKELLDKRKADMIL